MRQTVIRSASERRQAIRENAAAMGIDDAYISVLVETFYERVRAHPVLGPVFNDAIGDNWPEHLARMKDFWASVALNAGRYSGKPVPAHKKHASIKPQHFGVWLGLFEQTLTDTAPTPGALSYFMERAHRIAQSLQLALFGMPGLETETRA
ncbi:group III truncated hemoglobin [Hyphobacterium sp.]|uniref:group III truncated hemoglobin n=1 Tax=Hyphobacterium sp. TaxID=2004662 RepID=UPI003B52E44E